MDVRRALPDYTQVQLSEFSQMKMCGQCVNSLKICALFSLLAKAIAHILYDMARIFLKKNLASTHLIHICTCP